MEVHVKRETESRLHELAAQTGRPADDLLEDAIAAYLQELTQVRETLDTRYNDFKSGQVQSIDGEEALARLRRKSADRTSEDRQASRS